MKHFIKYSLLSSVLAFGSFSCGKASEGETAVNGSNNAEIELTLIGDSE